MNFFLSRPICSPLQRTRRRAPAGTRGANKANEGAPEWGTAAQTRGTQGTSTGGAKVPRAKRGGAPTSDGGPAAAGERPAVTGRGAAPRDTGSGKRTPPVHPAEEPGAGPADGRQAAQRAQLDPVRVRVEHAAHDRNQRQRHVQLVLGAPEVSFVATLNFNNFVKNTFWAQQIWISFGICDVNAWTKKIYKFQY